jgi:hypothetical protein
MIDPSQTVEPPRRVTDSILQQIVDGSEDWVPPKPEKVIQADFRPRIFLPGDGRLANNFCHELGNELAKSLKIFCQSWDHRCCR